MANGGTGSKRDMEEKKAKAACLCPVVFVLSTVPTLARVHGTVTVIGLKAALHVTVESGGEGVLSCAQRGKKNISQHVAQNIHRDNLNELTLFFFNPCEHICAAADLSYHGRYLLAIVVSSVCIFMIPVCHPSG